MKHLWLTIIALVCVWGGGCYRAEHSNPLDGHLSRLLDQGEGAGPSPSGPTLIQPNGTDQWYVGTMQQIVWRAGRPPVDTTVTLRLSIDDGQTYPYEIASALPNQGTYTWQVPDLPSKQCRVQVVADTASHDESNTSFSIFRKPVPQQMTFDGGEWPSWRGDRLAFMSNRTGNYDVWVLYLSNNQLVQVTTNPGFDGYPAWDKKGFHFAYTSDRTGQNEVWATSFFFDNRSDQVQLTTTGGEQPTWHPITASRKLAYLSRQFEQSNVAITEFSMPLTLSSAVAAPRLLTGDGGKVRPMWTIRPRDSAQVIYYKDIGLFSGVTEIRTIRADLTRLNRPSSIRLPFTSPARGYAVSASGTQLAVSVDGDIWVVQLIDGKVTGSPLQITFDPADEDLPDWNGDHSLAFQSRQTGQWEVWTVWLP